MKYRYSHQRELIYNVLDKAKKHLSAEEIHEKVKKKNDKVSLGTVYRNLGILEAEGKVAKLNLSSEKAVYEADSKPHHHLICTNCGDIKDIHDPANLKCVACLSWVKDFNIEKAYINAFGLCGKCKKK